MTAIASNILKSDFNVVASVRCLETSTFSSGGIDLGKVTNKAI